MDEDDRQALLRVLPQTLGHMGNLERMLAIFFYVNYLQYEY